MDAGTPLGDEIRLEELCSLLNVGKLQTIFEMVLRKVERQAQRIARVEEAFATRASQAEHNRLATSTRELDAFCRSKLDFFESELAKRPDKLAVDGALQSIQHEVSRKAERLQVEALGARVDDLSNELQKLRMAVGQKTDATDTQALKNDLLQKGRELEQMRGFLDIKADKAQVDSLRGAHQAAIAEIQALTKLVTCKVDRNELQLVQYQAETVAKKLEDHTSKTAEEIANMNNAHRASLNRITKTESQVSAAEHQVNSLADKFDASSKQLQQVSALLFQGVVPVGLGAPGSAAAESSRSTKAYLAAVRAVEKLEELLGSVQKESTHRDSDLRSVEDRLDKLSRAKADKRELELTIGKMASKEELEKLKRALSASETERERREGLARDEVGQLRGTVDEFRGTFHREFEVTRKTVAIHTQDLEVMKMIMKQKTSAPSAPPPIHVEVARGPDQTHAAAIEDHARLLTLLKDKIRTLEDAKLDKDELEESQRSLRTAFTQAMEKMRQYMQEHSIGRRDDGVILELQRGLDRALTQLQSKVDKSEWSRLRKLVEELQESSVMVVPSAPTSAAVAGAYRCLMCNTPAGLTPHLMRSRSQAVDFKPDGARDGRFSPTSSVYVLSQSADGAVSKLTTSTPTPRSMTPRRPSSARPSSPRTRGS